MPKYNEQVPQEGESGEDAYADAITQDQGNKRKRGAGICKICNQPGHYQKTCPQVTSASLNQTEQDDDVITTTNVAPSESSDLPKAKKSKHPKFTSNQGSLPLNTFSTGGAVASAYIPTAGASKDDSDYSSDDDMIQISHHTVPLELNEGDQSGMIWQQGTGVVQGESSGVVDDNRGVTNRRWGSWKNDIRRFVGSHFPIRVRDEKLEDGKVKDKRHRCKWATCKKKSKFRCLSCDVFLCIGSDEASNCFYQFHTIPNTDHQPK